MSNPHSKQPYNEATPALDESSDEELPSVSQQASVTSVPVRNKSPTPSFKSSSSSKRLSTKPELQRKGSTSSTTSTGSKLAQGLSKLSISSTAKTLAVDQDGDVIMSTNDDNDRGVRARNPDPYSGGAKDLERFLTQCRIYFLIKQKEFKNEQTQVLFSGGHLSGPAADWFSPLIRDLAAGATKPETQRIFNKYANFERALEQLYGNRDKQKVALRNLRQLRQTGSASQYTATFRRYALDTGLNEVGLREAYYNGLKENIKDEISRGTEPDDINELIERVITLDERFFERSLEKGRGNFQYKGNYSGGYGDYSNKPTKPYYGPQPMDLSATRGPLSKKDRDHRMQNNLCLYCGKPGHRARECKAKQRAGNTLNATRNQDEFEDYNDDGNDGPPQYLRASHTGPAYKGKGKDTEPKHGNTWESKRTKISQGETAVSDHACLSWTGCYNDSCLIHLGDKQGSGYYPRQRGRGRQRSPSPETASSASTTDKVPANEETSNIDDSNIRWNPDAAYVNRDANRIMTPDKMVYYTELSNGKAMILRRKAYPEETEDLVGNIGTQWIDIDNCVVIPRPKDDAARQGNHERRRSSSLPPNLKCETDLQPPEELIYTPTSSLTSNEQEL